MQQVDTDILGQHLTIRLVNGMAYVDYRKFEDFIEHNRYG